jgi:protein-S-isoprenylcysteine O-methyltransferase Ste14
MSVGHLLFAAVTTAYILVGIMLEERDLVAMFGDEYRRYRQRVPMLVPGLTVRPDTGSTPGSRPQRSATPAE